MYMRLKDGKRKVLTLSYDDGVIQDARLIKILNEYGIKGTFHVNSCVYIPGNEKKFSKRMTLSEAKELYMNSGHELAAHGLTHPFLDQLKSDEVVYEVMEDRKILEREFQTVVRGMSYPYGTYNDEVVDILKKCGIRYCRTTKSTEDFKFPTEWLTLHPTCHHKNPRLMELAEKFVAGNLRRESENRMFYLWGHSYEFDNDNNWDVIEEFAKYVGGRDDVWYATNIEIYDYVKAYENLQTSVDKKIVHNPSAIDVWVYMNGQTYAVKAGETIYL